MKKNGFLAALLTLALATLALAHGDATHLMGTVTAIQGDHATLKLQDGKAEMIMMNKATKYVANGKAAAKTDMKVGSRVVVDAKMDAKMKMYVAEQIQVGVAAPAAGGARTSPSSK